MSDRIQLGEELPPPNQPDVTEPTATTTSPTVPPKMPMISPTGFFSGFQIKYPEYEVITPQTLGSFTIRTLRVDEEEAMKASLVTPRKLPEHLNKVLWESLETKPEHIATMDNFLDSVTLKDREALMYGLFHITYKDDHNYNIGCPKCEYNYPVTINISSTFSSSVWEGGEFEILSKRIPIVLPNVNNVTAIIKQPTLRDEKNMMANPMFHSDKNMEVGIQMLVIEKFLTEDEHGRPVEITGADNIYRGYNGLPSADRKLINKTYVDNFGKYGIDMNMESTCISCGHTHETNIDLVTQFFRSMYE